MKIFAPSSFSSKNLRCSFVTLLSEKRDNDVNQLRRKQMKLKKAHLVYFVQKDSPKLMDYRFNYERTPESALKYRLGQWIRSSNGKLKKRIFMEGYDTRKEAEALMSKYNEELVKNCYWNKYEVVK